MRRCSKPVFRKSRIKCAIQNVTIATEELKKKSGGRKEKKRKERSLGLSFRRSNPRGLTCLFSVCWGGTRTCGCVCQLGPALGKNRSLAPYSFWWLPALLDLWPPPCLHPCLLLFCLCLISACLSAMTPMT